MLTVTTPATSYDLVRLGDARAALDLDRGDDANLARWISQASGAVARYCNRVLAQETVTETFRLASVQDSLLLSRYPVASITSVTEFDTVLEAADYEVNTSSGVLTRLSNDEPACWSASKITVSYIAGYSIDDVPGDIARAVTMLVQQYRFSGERDPQIRSESGDGLGSSSYFDGLENGGLSPEVRGLLVEYRKPAGV